MRKTVLFCCVLLLAACSKERVKITGSISDAGGSVLHLDEVDVYNTTPVDSVMLKKNGRFSFIINTKLPGFYQLRLSPEKTIVLFPKPGEHVKVEASANNMLSTLRIDGSHDTEQITKLIKMLNDARMQLDSISKLYTNASSDTMKERLDKEYQLILESHRKASITYILTHHSSLSSVYALYQQYRPGYYVFYKAADMQFFKIVSDSLAKYLPGSKHVKALKAYTNKMIGDYKAQLILNSAEKAGESLPAIALPDMKGDTITLSSLKGKYVLLSFWASYNQASVQQNLELKKIYQQYKNRGFEIYQISFDHSTENWQKAVRFDELPWISVIDTNYPNSLVAGNYNVTQLPSNYLIGKDNASILAKNLTPARLRDKLSELNQK